MGFIRWNGVQVLKIYTILFLDHILRTKLWCFAWIFNLTFLFIGFNMQKTLFLKVLITDDLINTVTATREDHWWTPTWTQQDETKRLTPFRVHTSWGWSVWGERRTAKYNSEEVWGKTPFSLLSTWFLKKLKWGDIVICSVSLSLSVCPSRYLLWNGCV